MTLNRFVICLSVLALALPVRADPIQWSVGAGGNGHWYDFVSAETTGPLTWDEARDDAGLRTFANSLGYLATLTSAEEDNFVRTNFATQIDESAGPWFGADWDGTSGGPTGGWHWVTGEPFVYTGWNPPEPNHAGGEDAIHFSNDFLPPGWNDIHRDRLDTSGYLIEYDGLANDLCANAMPITEGDTFFTNVNATTDGPALPLACAEFGELGFAADIWFTYTPERSGTVTISTCNQVDYDSRLAAYGGSCDNLLIGACNDDAPGCGQSSMITIPSIAAGETAIIRVGSFQFPTGQFSTGSGILTITLDPCPDFTGDADVGFADLTVLLAWWGECAGEPCLTYDLDESGDVGFTDLTRLLGAWGPC